MSVSKLSRVETVALIFSGIAALAATVQSYLLVQSRNELVKAIQFERKIDHCADLSAAVKRWGRELDSYYAGANGNSIFEGTPSHDAQIVRIYNARLDADIALERFLVTASKEDLKQAENLFSGSSLIKFGTSRENLTIIDEFTTALGRRLGNLRITCRSQTAI